MTINQKQPGDSGYVFFYNQKRIELYAPNLSKASEMACNHFKPPKSKRHMVHGGLAERADGSEVVNIADF